jgi:hypothetical protein
MLLATDTGTTSGVMLLLAGIALTLYGWWGWRNGLPPKPEGKRDMDWLIGSRYRHNKIIFRVLGPAFLVLGLLSRFGG